MPLSWCLRCRCQDYPCPRSTVSWGSLTCQWTSCLTRLSCCCCQCWAVRLGGPPPLGVWQLARNPDEAGTQRYFPGLWCSRPPQIGWLGTLRRGTPSATLRTSRAPKCSASCCCLRICSGRFVLVRCLGPCTVVCPRLHGICPSSMRKKCLVGAAVSGVKPRKNILVGVQ